jgi:hypothetical protein
MFYDTLSDLVGRYDSEQSKKLSHVGIWGGQEELDHRDVD